MPNPFRRRGAGPARAPSTAPGWRIYALGDIHGQVDLLRTLLLGIERDSEGRPPARVATVLIGDFIDRGPGAAALLSALTGRGPPGLICLLGNHEATLIDAYRGDLEALSMWLEYGGRETLLGFGADRQALGSLYGAQLLEMLRALIPRECIEWLETLPLTWSNGDYLFVHAGVRPGRRLSRQRRRDLLWIRDDFLDDARWHGKMIVHGHSPRREVEFRANRIGIDTGAYSSGRLSAVGLQDHERWVLHT